MKNKDSERIYKGRGGWDFLDQNSFQSQVMFQSNTLFPLQHEWISHHGRNITLTEENLFLHMFAILKRLQILNSFHHNNSVNSLKGGLKYILSMKIYLLRKPRTHNIKELNMYLSGERYINLVLRWLDRGH